MFDRVRDSTRHRAAGLRLLTLLTVCFTAYLFGVGLVGAAKAQEGVPHPATDYPKTIDPWEVILYENPNYSGMWIRYKMEPGMRQRVVSRIHPDMEDKVSSIQVGSKVNVLIFANRYFNGGDSSLYEVGDFGGFANLEVSQARLGAYEPLDDKISSLVVYPKAAKQPLGGWIYDERTVTNTWSTGEHEVTFFPLPEWEHQVEAGYNRLDIVNLDKNANVVAPPGSGVKIWRQAKADWGDHVEVILYERMNFQGASLALPGNCHWGNLGDCGWSDRAASLIVKWKGPPLALGPPIPPPNRVNAPSSAGLQQGVNLPGRDYKSFFMDGGPEVCERACAADPNCRAFTWVKPGVQGAKAACWLKSSVPPAINDPDCVSGYSNTKPQLPSGEGRVMFTPDISGKWQSNNGAIYKITQMGDRFSWNIKNSNEKGSGQLTGVQISASWTGDKGSGNATGKVIVDDSGSAIRIEWNNGAVFLRQ